MMKNAFPLLFLTLIFSSGSFAQVSGSAIKEGLGISKPLIPPKKSGQRLIPAERLVAKPVGLGSADKISGAKPGGWGSSGGGSGVACFANTTFAIQADDFIQKSRPLPPELKKQITSLETLDYWEWTQKKNYKLFDFKSKTANGIISEMQARIQFVAPIFIYRLQQTTEVIRVADWSAQESVPRIVDAKPLQSLSDNCRLIQLAARYTKGSYIHGDGPTLRRPVVAIDFDQDLFSRLSPLNQAVLIVHEQMYLLGQTTGKNTSDEIRPLVMRLFAATMSDRNLRWDLVAVFGDYVLFFGEDFKAKGNLGNQESRFNSFYEVLRAVQSTRQLCIQNKGLPVDPKTDQEIQGTKDCLDASMNPWAMEDKLNQEQSFVFLIYFVADIMQHALNAEVIIAPIQNKEYKELAELRVQQSCQYLAVQGSQLTLEKMISKAQSYCVSLFPKGINQN